MSNKTNLIPGAHRLTPEEMSKGGTNAAKARKERREIKSLAMAILDMPLHGGKMVDAEDLPSLSDIESANVDVRTKIIATLAVKALKGNVNATQTLFTLTGEYTTRQETVVDVDASMDYDYTITIGGDPSKAHMLTYKDKHGNPIKTIYGEEAARIAYERGAWNEPLNLIEHTDE